MEKQMGNRMEPGINIVLRRGLAEESMPQTLHALSIAECHDSKANYHIPQVLQLFQLLLG